jgi:LPXTG-motif cell wall-anchored protein
MKRSFVPAFGGALLAFCLAVPVLAEDVSYNGTPPPSLQNLNYEGGSAFGSSLAPTGSNDYSVFPLAKSPSVGGGSATAPTNSVSLLPPAGFLAYVFGAVNFRDADAVNYNQVTMSGGTLLVDVSGAFHRRNNENTQAVYNRVTVNGGTIMFGGGAYGGRAMSAVSGNADASNNAVIISGGTVDYVVGGHAQSPNGNATASNNTVEIRDGVIEGFVVGGWTPAATGSAVASNNTIKISAAPPTLNLSDTELYGGYAPGAGSSIGNTLEIAAAAAGVTVDTVTNFQKLNFELPASLAPSAAMLTVTGTGTGGLYLGTDAVVSVSAPGLVVNTGDTFTLIDVTGTTFSGTAVAAPGSTLNGYTYTVERDANKLLLKIGPRGPTPSITAVPATGSSILVALGLLLAGLAMVALRRNRD